MALALAAFDVGTGVVAEAGVIWETAPAEVEVGNIDDVMVSMFEDGAGVLELKLCAILIKTPVASQNFIIVSGRESKSSAPHDFRAQFSTEVLRQHHLSKVLGAKVKVGFRTQFVPHPDIRS